MSTGDDAFSQYVHAKFMNW